MPIKDGYCKGCRFLDKKYDSKGVRRLFCRQAQLFLGRLTVCPLSVPGYTSTIEL